VVLLFSSNRSDAANSDPSHVIPTLAYHLAQFSPQFAEKLVEKVQERRDIRRISLKTQFETLLEEPSNVVAALADQPPIIILIDGLDECGDEKSRKGFLEILSKCVPKLPPLFRILAASRDEKDIRSAFSQPDINIEKIPLRTEDDNTTRDIAEYFRQRLMSIAKNSGRPSNWPELDVIKQLTQCAGGLFIWASTAVGFVEDGPPDERLQTLLDISAQGESLAKLDKLYHLTLLNQFESFFPREHETLRQILGAIMVAREGLTDDVLCQLLGLKLQTVHDFLSRLCSLLQWNSGERIGAHASFLEFLGDRERCTDLRWYIDEPAHHRRLTAACFGIMHNHLRFNICGLETSYYKNKAINRINELVDENITADIMYGCQYWAYHLDLGVTTGSTTAGFPGEIRFFLRERFLFWLEVFSLKDCLGTTPTILRVAAGWCKVLISWIYGE
jgi:hypothetical protein